MDGIHTFTIGRAFSPHRSEKGYTYPSIAHVRSAVLGVPGRLQDSARNFNSPGLADTTDVYLPTTLHVQGGVGENPVQSIVSTCIFIIRSLGDITSLANIFFEAVRSYQEPHLNPFRVPTTKSQNTPEA